MSETPEPQPLTEADLDWLLDEFYGLEGTVEQEFGPSSDPDALSRRAAQIIAAARAMLTDLCDHPSSTGDEGPVRDLGSGHVVRWRCDGCGTVHYSDHALASARAEHRAAVAQTVELANLLNDTAAERDSLRGVVQAVAHLHRKITTTDDFGFCTGCEFSWPCPTARALAAAADAPQPKRLTRDDVDDLLCAAYPNQKRFSVSDVLDVVMPLLAGAAADRVRADVLKLHQRCDNGHCSCGALRWPCSTARVVAADAPQPEQACEATVSVDQISDDYEGLVPHPFPCRLDACHEPDDPHEALVTWFTGEDE